MAVVIHGGFWRDTYDRSLMDGLCEDLAGAGLSAWNLEYRRLGGGGGWPQTFEDVAAGIDSLSGFSELRNAPSSPRPRPACRSACRSSSCTGTGTRSCLQR